MELDQAALLACHILDLRRRRTDHLPDELFGEAAWGLLLTMFVADARGERLGIGEACRRAGGARGVSERWLMVLQERGLAACRGGRGDDRLVSLTPAGVHAMEACMEDVRKLMDPRRPGPSG